MNHFKYSITLITAAFFLSACGGGSNGSNIQNAVQMQIGESYNVYEGQRIERYTADTRITIETDLERYTTTAILHAGSASIVTE